MSEQAASTPQPHNNTNILQPSTNSELKNNQLNWLFETNKHSQEWIEGSGVHPDIFDLNVISLESNKACLDWLLVGNLKRNNSGRVELGVLRKYNSISSGWVVAGVELDEDGELIESDWCCLKPDSPRIHEDGKPIKYEHPPSYPTQIFALKIPDSIRKKIAQRYGVKVPKWAVGLKFWEWLKKSNLPLTITEGVKKAAALLTLGIPAIGISGIYNFQEYLDQSYKRKDLKPVIQHLIEDRSIYIAFDASEKLKGNEDVLNATKKFYYDLKRHNVRDVFIPTWTIEDGKGVDDVLVNRGEAFINDIFKNSKSWWQHNHKKHKNYDHNVKLINKRYLALEDIALPQKCVVSDSAKGTGKSTVVKSLENSLPENVPVLVVTPTITLGKKIAKDNGLYFQTESDEREIKISLKFRRQSVVINSVREDSAAKIDPEAFRGGVLILDETSAIIKALLMSGTLKDYRSDVIQTLKEYMAVASKIYCFSADTDKTTVDVIKFLSGCDNDLNFIYIKNEWNKNNFKTYTYPGKKELMTKILEKAEELVETGGRIAIAACSQKPSSKFSAQNIAKWLEGEVPGLKVLVADGKTCRQKDHPASKLAENPAIINDYHVLVYTSAIAEGISFDADIYNCQSVYGFFYAIYESDRVCQMLMRVRAMCDRHIYVQKALPGKEGGSFDSKTIRRRQQKRFNDQSKIISQLAPFTQEIEVDGREETITPLLTAEAEYIAVYNYEMANYRRCVFEKLKTEGATIIEVESEEVLNAIDLDELKEVASKSTETYSVSVVESKLIWDETQKDLEKKDLQTEEEQLQIDKFWLHKKYEVELTPEIVQADLKDDIFNKLKIRFYINNPELVRKFEDETTEVVDPLVLKETEKYSENRFKYKSDVFRGSLYKKVELLRKLNLRRFCKPGRYHVKHPEVLEVLSLIDKYREEINLYFGKKYDPEKSDRMKFINNLLEYEGLKWSKSIKVLDYQHGRINIRNSAIDTLKESIGESKLEEILDIWKIKIVDKTAFDDWIDFLKDEENQKYSERLSRKNEEYLKTSLGEEKYQEHLKWLEENKDF